MVKRLTTEEFIIKAMKVHGDYYDYSNVNYINIRTKVKIICKKHGEFYQNPNDHLNGRGCRKCGFQKISVKNKGRDFFKRYSIQNKRYGRLLVLKLHDRKRKNLLWECLCDCGNVCYATSNSLISGTKKSCGCLLKDTNKLRSITHGKSNSSEYEAWLQMKQRCYNTNNKDYSNYGARGITVCDRWLNSFKNFYEDMGDKSFKNLSIERIDNEKGYSKENCYWATSIEQNNNKRSSVFITYNGETHTIAEWSRTTKISYGTLKNRIYNNWSLEDALTKPVGRNR